MVAVMRESCAGHAQEPFGDTLQFGILWNLWASVCTSPDAWKHIGKHMENTITLCLLGTLLEDSIFTVGMPSTINIL